MMKGLGLDAAEVSATSGTAAKRSKVTEKDRHAEYMTIVSKLLLNVAMQARIHKSILIECIKTPVDCPYYISHKEGTTQFTLAAKKLKEQGKTPMEIKEAIGTPSVHGFNAMVAQYMEAKNPKNAQMGVATKLWEAQNGWKTVHFHIKHCRYSKMFHNTEKRLEISAPFENQTNKDEAQEDQLTPTWAWMQIREVILKNPKAYQMEGVAPPGDLERKVQEWIDENTK